MNETRRKYQDEYRQHKSVLLKFKQAFPEHIYVITKAPKFETDEDGDKVCTKKYIPFPKEKDLREDLKGSKELVGVNIKQKLKLTSEEAYSFSVIR